MFFLVACQSHWALVSPFASSLQRHPVTPIDQWPHLAAAFFFFNPASMLLGMSRDFKKKAPPVLLSPQLAMFGVYSL